MEISFVKGVGSGNDFVIIERKYFDKDLPKIILNRIYGVGGDGLIVYENNRVWFYNPDGSKVSMCGNGVRVLFLHLYNNGTVKSEDEIKTDSGNVRCRIIKDNVQMDIPFCKIESENPVIVRCGVPHLLIETNNIDNIDIQKKGFELSNFLKERNNVDFYEIKRNKVIIRTYERGVENETLSCGSGIASVAFYLHQKKYINKFLFITRGGNFNVRVDKNIVGLIGEIKFTMKGVFLWKNF